MLQERGGSSFTHEALTLKYKLDNEFELVFVVSIFSFFIKHIWFSILIPKMVDKPSKYKTLLFDIYT